MIYTQHGVPVIIRRVISDVEVEVEAVDDGPRWIRSMAKFRLSADGGPHEIDAEIEAAERVNGE